MDLTQAFTYLVSQFVAIFVIVDPFAVIPVYLTFTDRFSPDMIQHTRRKATLVAMGILLVFATTGLSIFKFFGITLPAFQIAGGILLLFLGMAQLNANRPRVRAEEQSESLERDDVSVFPLGTPLLAGPGAISTVVLHATESTGIGKTLVLMVAIALAMGASYLVLKSAHTLYRVLGRTGLNILTRIMGIILTAVAIQFVLNGVRGALVMMGVMNG